VAQPLDDQAIRDKWLKSAPLIERMMERVGTEGEFPVEAGSSLSGDDKASSPYQLSHGLRMCLAAGVDHLHAVKVLVVDNEILHVGATSSLARGALENFSTAYWILGPDSRNERVARMLRWYAKNFKDSAKATDPLKLPGTKALTEKLEQLYVVGRTRGSPDKTIYGTFTSTDAVTYTEKTAPNLPLGVVLPWQLCSGFAHGRPWAYLGVPNREEFPVPNSDIVNVRMTSSLGTALYPNLAALQLLERFLQLYEQRANCQRARGVPGTRGPSSTRPLGHVPLGCASVFGR